MVSLPVLDDNYSYYMFLPFMSTLYGHHDFPRRFIRVVDDDVPNQINTITRNGETLATVKTICISDYLRGITYGVTSYIEPLFSGLTHGLDIGKYKEAILTQAMLRDYEHRTDTLLSLCKRKKESFASTRLHPAATEELIAETEGTLCCWKHLMDTGRIRPTDCILAGDNNSRVKATSIPLSDFTERYLILKNRMLNENFVALPYKMTSEQRVSMLSAFYRI